MNNLKQADLYFLILLPANEAARRSCQQMESSSRCEVQLDANHLQSGVIYTCRRQESTELL